MSFNLTVQKVCKCVQFNLLWPDKRKIWYICSTPNLTPLILRMGPTSGFNQILNQFASKGFPLSVLCPLCRPLPYLLHMYHKFLVNVNTLIFCWIYLENIRDGPLSGKNPQRRRKYLTKKSSTLSMWLILETALSQERFLKEDVNISPKKVQLYLCGGEVQKMMGHYNKVVSWWVGVVKGQME